MTQENTTPPPPTPKKRNMKIVALAAICIILAASLVGVGALYLTKPASNADLNAQLTQKNALIASLNQTIANLQANAASSASAATYQAAISSLTTQLSTANSQISDLQTIVNMNYTDRIADSQFLTQQAPNTSDDIYNDLLGNAGFIVVTVNSNSTTTYAETTFRYVGTDFNFTQTIGTSGTAMFLVMPTYVDVRVGNLETTNITNTTVTIDYYY